MQIITENVDQEKPSLAQAKNQKREDFEILRKSL